MQRDGARGGEFGGGEGLVRHALAGRGPEGVVQQIIVVAAGSNVSLFVPIIVILDGWVRVVGPVFLGIVAIALASRESAVAASVREQES